MSLYGLNQRSTLNGPSGLNSPLACQCSSHVCAQYGCQANRSSHSSNEAAKSTGLANFGTQQSAPGPSDTLTLARAIDRLAAALERVKLPTA